MKPRTLGAFTDELEKIAISGRVIGAGLGAGFLGAREALSEWDRVRTKPPRPSDRMTATKSGFGRVLGSAALGGAGGAIIGHFGMQAGKLVKRHAQDVSTETSRILAKGFGDAIRHELVHGMVQSSEQIGKNLARGSVASIDPVVQNAAERASKAMAHNFEQAVERAAEKMKPIARGIGEEMAAGAKSQFTFPTLNPFKRK